MKALIYQGVRNVAYKEVGKPTIGSYDCLVRNVRSGICGSDMTAYEVDGKYVGIAVGHEFGHEFVGYVAEVGENVEGVSVGDRVWVNPCRSVKETWQSDMAGGFSEYAVVHNAKYNDSLWKLPDSLSYDDAVLIEPFCVATHGKNRARCKPEDKVVIYGAGIIGTLALCSLVAQGNKKVVVVDRSKPRLEMAQSIGAIPFDAGSGEDLTVFLQKTFGTVDINGYHSADVDAVIDCIGAPALFEQFTEFAKPGARYAVVAVYKQPVSLDFATVMSEEFEILGSRGYNEKDIREVINNLSRRTPKGIETVVTHTFPLCEATKAFETACNRDAAMKVVFNME